MKIIWAGILAATFTALPALADHKDEAPVAVRQPEPDYGPELSKSYLVNPAKITMIFDNDGVPFSLSSTEGLPDTVVRALSEWRYRPAKKDGRNVPFSVSFAYPLRAPLDSSSERSLRRKNPYIDKVVETAYQSGTGLDAAGAENLEQKLLVDFNDIDSRAALLLYSIETASKNPKEAAERRARHIEYLVQNLPGDRILASPFTLINTGAGLLPDADAYARIRDLWLKIAALRADDPAILEHASYFLRVSDPEKAEQLLLPAIHVLPNASIWLGELYGIAILGENGVDLKTGLASSASSTLPATPFAQKARAALLGTDNAKVLFAALNSLTDNARALAHAGGLPQGYPELCNQLLGRAKAFFPGTGISCDPAAASDVPAPEIRLRVGGNVQSANLIKKVPPTYPYRAKATGIQGTVKFTAIIAKDGHISDLNLISGPLALYQSARDALQKWEYRPTRLNGTPVEVVTTLEVNYTLGR